MNACAVANAVFIYVIFSTFQRCTKLLNINQKPANV